VGTGVLAFESDLVSPFELTSTGIVVEFEDDGDSFDGDSSLTTTDAGGSNRCKTLDGSLRVTTRLCLVDFFRGPAAVVDLFDEAIVVRLLGMRCARSCGRRKGAGKRRSKLKSVRTSRRFGEVLYTYRNPTRFCDADG
jgi:hypothetical protein